MANYYNDTDNRLITGTSGNDSVYNDLGFYCTISTGAGNDTIYNDNGDASSINAGAGNDSIYGNDNDTVTVDAGAGADTIDGSYWYSYIDGGAGNDSITGFYNSSSTIEGGKGNDTIRNSNSSGYTTYIYTAGDGNDIIYGFEDYDTLSISGGSYSMKTSGKNIIVTVGKGKISLIGAASLSTVNINDGSSGGEEENLFITGTSGADYLYNTLSSATIDALGGNDTIENDNGDASSINAGAGNDSIYGYDNDTVTVDAGAGADTIDGSYWYSYIDGGAGNDSITGSYNSSSTIEGGKGNDTIRNSNSSGYITYIYTAGDGNDIIYGFGDYDTLSISGGSYSMTKSGKNIIVTFGNGKISLMGAASLSTVYINDGSGGEEESLFITGTSGADYLYNSLSSATIDALGGNDIIENDNGDASSINAGAGNDSIYGYDNDGVTVDAGAGADTINGTYYGSSINGGAGNDYISNYDSDYANDNVTVDAGAGADTIDGDYYWSSINGGAGNDSITVDYYGYNTIEGGKGNDTIRNNGIFNSNTYIYTAGDGNDKIFGFDETSTLSISGGSYSTKTSGKNIIVTVGDGKISLMGAASLSTVNINDGSGGGEEESLFISGTSGKDSIYNTLSSATIDALGGNDTINNDNGDASSINAGAGNDSIYAYDNDTVTVDAGAGADTIAGTYYWSSINGGAGNDSITGDYYSGNTIEGGKGNDTIRNNASFSSITYIYTAGDGNDKIFGFNEGDTLSISGGTYSTTKSGNNIIVTVGDGKISLMGAASLSAGYIDGEETPIETNSWTYKNGRATYGTSSKTLCTVEGVKSADGLSIDNKVVTVDKASLNKKTITITGTGYTLALASGNSSTTKKAVWTKNGTTATYKSSYKTAGYKLANNAKSISYTAATTPTTLASVKGAASTSGLTVSGSKITLKKSALKNKVTVSGAYEFDFASGYSTATITGTAKADTITARGTNISINAGKGDDTIKLFGTATITGGDGADTFIYNKGNDVIADYKAEDTISISSGTAATSTSGEDLILTVGTGKITVTGGTGSTVTYFDDGGKHTYQKASDTVEGVKITNSGKVVTLTDDYSEDTFNAVDLSKVVTINASKVSQALEITGNKKSNVITGTNDDDKIYGLNGADTIRGGKGSDYIEGGNGADEIYGGTGSDTLWGGAGDDILSGGDGNNVFVYGNDDGHDIITDYTDIDHIMILSGEKPALAYTPLSNNMTFTIGNGSIVIENPQGQNIKFIKSDGSYLHYESVIRSAK